MRRAGLAMVMLFVALFDARTAFAHEKWFVRDLSKYPVRLDLLFSLPVLAALLVSAGAVAVATYIDRRYRMRQRIKNPTLENALLGVGESKLRRIYAFLPLLLAVHTAIPLLISGFQLQLFSPNLQMHQNLLSGLVGLAEVLIALALVYGVFSDYAALALIGLFVAGVVLGPFLGIPSLYVLEHIDFVGIGFFLYVIGRGPFSADALLGRRTQPDAAMVRFAAPALRWGLGLSVVYLAFTEKLLNPALAEAFLRQKIDFNVGSAFGLPDPLFIVLAGIGELMFGTLLLSGALPRLVIAAMWVPFNLTLPYLGWVELAGHLPIYGIMLTLLIIGPTSHRAAQHTATLLLQEARAERREQADEAERLAAHLPQ